MPPFMKAMGNLAKEYKVSAKVSKEKKAAKAKRAKIIKQQRAKDAKEEAKVAKELAKLAAIAKKESDKMDVDSAEPTGFSRPDAR